MVDYDDWEVSEDNEGVFDGTGTATGSATDADVTAGDVVTDTATTSDTNTTPTVDIPDRPSVFIQSYYEIPESRGNVYSEYDESRKIELTFPQPNVSKDTSIRTVEHEVIGDKTVVQKVGEEADEIDVEGICTRDESKDIDKLATDDVLYLRSHRHEGYMILDSTSTSPIADGGGIIGTTSDGKKFEWTHEFTISGMGIERPKRI